jgi:hypothetical protein
LAEKRSAHDVIGTHRHAGRDCQPKPGGGPQLEDQFVVRRLLHEQVCGPRPAH